MPRRQRQPRRATAAFLAIGVYGGSLLISVPFGIVTLVAAAALVRAVRADRAVRRIERSRGSDSGRM
jgi:hypothetical protein